MAILFWLALAILAGVYANKLNRSGFGYFLLSVFLTPLIGFAALLVLGELKVQVETPRKPKYFTEEELKEGKLCIADSLVNIDPNTNNISSNHIDNLIKLGELLEKGLLTKDEFEAQKAILLK